MCPRVLLQVAEGGEVFVAVVAVEGLSVVQAQVGTQTVARVERLCTTRLGTLEGLLFRVDAHVDLETVGGEEGLAAALLVAFEAVLAWKGGNGGTVTDNDCVGVCASSYRNQSTGWWRPIIIDWRSKQSMEKYVRLTAMRFQVRL